MFAIYKKELQSFFKTPFAYIITALFLFLFTLSFNRGISDINSAKMQFTYSDIFATNLFYFAFIVPVLTMRCFPDERKFGTEVLIMTSPVNVFQFVTAKFLAIVTVFLFMMTASLIYPIITEVYGTVVVPALISVYIGFFLWGVMCIAIGMFCASFSENSIIAAVIGEAAMLLLTFINYFVTSEYFSAHPKLQSFAMMFAAEDKFNYFAQGIIRFSDVIFFITVIIVFVAWTVISLEARRWKKG
ncbi:MAG: ABC transporter permease [Ruminococcus sp.]|nr:ABC transporter permease [Oscillospiraceae bacterium]MDY4413146.1 ABC transporter permease [Ruminococcus sp.]